MTAPGQLYEAVGRVVHEHGDRFEDTALLLLGRATPEQREQAVARLRAYLNEARRVAVLLEVANTKMSETVERVRRLAHGPADDALRGLCVFLNKLATAPVLEAGLLATEEAPERILAIAKVYGDLRELGVSASRAVGPEGGAA